MLHTPRIGPHALRVTGLVALVLVAALLPAGRSDASTRASIRLTARSASWGIVAGNTVWKQRAIAWTVGLTAVPSTDRVVVQTYSAGRWKTVTTRITRRTSAAASGTFFPLFGRHSYRVAAVTRTGGLAAATSSFAATGYATQPLQRLTVKPVATASGTVTADGVTVPALWYAAEMHQPLPTDPADATIAAGRCQSLLLMTKVTYAGPPGAVGRVGVVVAYQPSQYVVDAGIMAVEATSPAGQAPAGAHPAAFVSSTVLSSYALWFHVWATDAYGFPYTWPSGEAWAGGVGLCSSRAR